MQKKFTFIDLFAGIGGFRIACQDAGGECVFSSEWNISAQETYKNNFNETPYGDITLDETKSKIPEHFDLLCGGFPCQPFSICGKKRGFEDTRGTLFFDVCEILRQHDPKCVLLENVQHLINHDKGNTFRVIISCLEELEYNVTFKVLNAKDFGLPQSRERIFIVGTKKGLFNFDMLRRMKTPMLNDFLDDSGDFEFLKDNEYTILSPELQKVQDSGLLFVGYRNKGMWSKGIRPHTEHLSRCHRQPNRIYSIYGVHPTLPSQETSGRFFIYLPESNQVRKLTINECYRIMGFPNNFIKHPTRGEQYKQIGNSIAIPVVREIVNQLISQKLL